MKSPLRRLASELLPLPAMKWLGLAISTWALGGCILPQDEEYLSSLPVPLNHPLRIVEQQVSPPERILRGYGNDLCELEFSVIVEDPDLGDTLVAYWFVDYDASQPRIDAEVSIEPKGNKPVRDERASFHVRVSDLNRLNVPGDHVVEVVVTDSSLVGREPQPKNIIHTDDGTDYRDPGYTATYAWFVRTESGGCP
ncbi:hypothetical protein [Archangium sp.]|uniref:hypothetical protein n=1 Tax=Archangium sp. TaxID=1872627 RepID=UPI003899F1EC